MILGICGFQSSGKDTVADYLINNYGFKKLSFAGALKDIVAIMFSWSREKLEGLTKEDREWREEIDIWWEKSLDIPNLTPRYVLQHFGTDLFRNHWHKDIWVKILEKKLSDYENIVVTDCRFENEINILKKYGGKILHIHRKMPEWYFRCREGEEVEELKYIHPSETQWIRCHCDYNINNDESIEELHKTVYNVIKYIS
jgi:dephospho-CoA kinase